MIGPHSIASFTTEYRAFMFNVWGTWHWVAPGGRRGSLDHQDAGWIDGFGFDEEGAKIDPRKRDGLYLGPSRGHVDDERAGEIGMFRAYGYGATMGAWTHRLRRLLGRPRRLRPPLEVAVPRARLRRRRHLRRRAR